MTVSTPLGLGVPPASSGFWIVGPTRLILTPGSLIFSQLNMPRASIFSHSLLLLPECSSESDTSIRSKVKTAIFRMIFILIIFDNTQLYVIEIVNNNVSFEGSCRCRPSLSSFFCYCPPHSLGPCLLFKHQRWPKLYIKMIEISIGTIAWVGVIVLQAYIHFVALPRQRLRLEEDRKVENEIRKSVELNGVCNAATYQRSGYSKEDLAILASADSFDEVEDCDSCSGSSNSSPRRSDPTTITGPQHLHRLRQRGIGPDGLPDPDEDEDLDPIDDGEEDARLELLKYYYSTNTPPLYSYEPFKSSCGSISSLEDDPDLSSKKKNSATSGKTSDFHDSSISQPILQQESREPAVNSAIRRRTTATRRERRHVGFVQDVSAVNSAWVHR